MAVQLSARKCKTCAGTLEYRGKNTWVCRYCGNQYVFEEQYDGLYTVKDMVRQTLKETAYRRLQNAEKNLTECERVNSRYVGTILARICYRYICLITPGSTANELAAVKQQIVADFNRLGERSGIDEEEEALRGFLADGDCADDIFAILFIVFASLNDKLRADFYFQEIRLERVYSKDCNRDLISLCAQTGRTREAGIVAANREHIDPRTALNTVLSRFPDGDDKRKAIGMLADGELLDSRDREQIGKYLCGGDSSATKAALIGAIRNPRALPDTELMIRELLAKADAGELEQALDGICSGSMTDKERFALLDYALHESTPKALVILRRMADAGDTVTLQKTKINSLFLNRKGPAEDRLKLWQELRRFRITEFNQAAAAADYLTDGQDSPEDRAVILEALLQGVKALPVPKVESYLTKCTFDGARKPNVLERLFQLEEMRPEQFNLSLELYMAHSPDPAEIASAVIDKLISLGLTMSPNGIEDYLAAGGQNSADKIETLRRLANRGCRPGADSLSKYLETSGSRASADVVSFLSGYATAVSAKAMENFVLLSPDQGSVKVERAAALSTLQAGSFGSSPCSVRHLGHTIACNLAQAYLLVGADSFETAAAMLKKMTEHSRLDSGVTVDGLPVRFKKYLKDNKAKLSEDTARLAESFRLFALF